MTLVLAAAVKSIRIVMEKVSNKFNKIVEPVNANEVSRIAQGVSIKGDITSHSDIRVDGQIEGTIFSEGRIVVGETAVMKGRLLCNDTDFWGRMDGDIFVRNVLSIKGSAVINGNIHVRKIQVEMGAQINGSCHMITEEEFDAAAGKVVETDASASTMPTNGQA